MIHALANPRRFHLDSLLGSAPAQPQKRHHGRSVTVLHHSFSLGVSSPVPERGSAPSGSNSDRRNLSSSHQDRKSTRLNSSHANISYAVFCLKKKKTPTL